MPTIRTLKPTVKLAAIARASTQLVETPRLRGKALQQRNRRFLRANPLCAQCEKRGRVAAAVECDHVVPLWRGGADDEANLQGLCDECHKAKTKAEATERAAGAAR